jgi:hypothetical protein
MGTRGAVYPLAALASVTVLALAGCGGDDEGSAGESPTTTETGAGGGAINGSVGPGFEISVEDADGLAPGTYELVVEDQSASHNFHLTGQGVDVKTEVEDEGQKTFTIMLQAGEYRFVCDPHSSSMNGSFTVSE